MIDKDLVKKAYECGAFTILMEVLKEMQNKDKDFDFSTDPCVNAYNLGKRDRMNSLITEIEDNIKFYCN